MDSLTIGQTVRTRRKSLGVSATALASAAGISRVTLHRIESGEGASSLKSYIDVFDALNLELSVKSVGEYTSTPPANTNDDVLPVHISLEANPVFKNIAWHVTGRDYLTLREAWDLYERNRRHIQLSEISTEERHLISLLESAMG